MRFPLGLQPLVFVALKGLHHSNPVHFVTFCQLLVLNEKSIFEMKELNSLKLLYTNLAFPSAFNLSWIQVTVFKLAVKALKTKANNGYEISQYQFCCRKKNCTGQRLELKDP